MTYESLYDELTSLLKEYSELMKFQQKAYKNFTGNLEKGDLKTLSKELPVFLETNAQQAKILTSMGEILENFDANTYMQCGDFSNQMLEICQKLYIDIIGEFPVYEVFPYKVRLDTENTDVYVDRKKVQCLRPLTLITDIKKGRDKLLRAPFNAGNFANELANVYDTALLKQSKGKAYAVDADFYLTGLYKHLTPMSRFRKDYDQQSFAFDLARLYSSDVITVSDGRKFQFGPSRNINKAIRILDTNGMEQFLATIRFYTV